MIKFEEATYSNSAVRSSDPCTLSIKTAVEICPKTLTLVRIMSGMRSIPNIKARPATGTPIDSSAGAMVTTLEDGTGATVRETRNVARTIAPAAPIATGTL